jgi:hypothetical protein
VNSTLTTSKKAQALLIALANIDLVLAANHFLKIDTALCSSVITAIMALVGVYVAAQGAVDTVTANNTTTTTSPTTPTT